MSHPEITGHVRRQASKVSLLGAAAEKRLEEGMSNLPIVTVESANNEKELPAAVKSGATLKMPSTQAARLTKAFNRLLEMRRAGSAEGVVLLQMEAVREEIQALRKKCQEVLPAGSEQNEFKELWMQKHLEGRERFMAQLEEGIEGDDGMEEREGQHLQPSEAGGEEPSVYGCHSHVSATSSVRQALIQAEENHAMLEMRMRQLGEQQEARRRLQERQRRERLLQEAEEQALIEQKERHELEQQMEGLRVRKEALQRVASQAGSRASSSRASSRGSCVQQPTEAWLRETRESRRGPTAIEREHENEMEGNRANDTVLPPPAGGFVAATAPSPHVDMQGQLLQHILLSQTKLPVFKGDALEFLWFCKAFEAQVSSVTLDPERRLYLLLQQLQGPPYDLVKGCQLMNPAHGFDRAMQKLQERYGHPVRQAMAFRNKLMTWPNVRSALELENFNVQLQLCQDVKLAGHGLGELDSPATILQLASKLSAKLQLAWQTKAFDIETAHHRAASYDDFAKFIQRQAGLRLHPVYGKLSSVRDTKDGKGEDGRTAKAAATTTVGNGGGDRGIVTEVEEPVTVAAVKETPMKKSSNGTSSNRSSKGESSNASANAFKPPCLLCTGNHATDKCAKHNLTRKQMYEKLQGLCFACLKNGHIARSCPERATCNRCSGRHPTILHRDIPPKSEVQGPKTDTNPNETTMATEGDQDCAVSTVPVKVWCNGQDPIEVYAILDPASTATFVTGTLARQLQTHVTKTEIGVTTMSSRAARLPVGVVQNLTIAGIEEEVEFTVPTAYTVEQLPFQDVPTREETEKWTHLEEVPFLYKPNAPVAMLIGLNVAGALWPLKVVHGQKHEPYAVKTPLGWALQGPLRANQGQRTKGRNATVCWTRATDVKKDVQRLFYRDFDKAFDFDEKGPSQDDRTWQAIVERTARRKPIEGQEAAFQYIIELPFRKQAVQALKDNRQQAVQRLESLRRKFQRSEQFRTDYRAFMTKMLEAGYVEEVQDDMGTMTESVIHYVPHHGVYHPKKPGKIRVVFNCANKFHGIALNDCLLSGPDLTNSLVGVLLRFRQHRVALMADVESMFYRVQVPQSQRDVLRFLWWKGEEDEERQKVSTYRLKVHLFGATSSPSVANFALRKAAEEAHQEGKVGKEVSEAVRRNFYVDDCLKAVATEEEAVRIAHGLIAACAYGGFRLTKFVSTSRELLRSLPPSERAKDLENVDLNDDKNDPLGSLQERALGVAWHVQQDCFQFKIANMEEERQKAHHVSKRTVLSKLSALYDPLGMAAPYVIVARILFRELTKGDLGWDESLKNEQQRRRWCSWEEDLPQLRQVSVPRCLLKEERADCQLHIFCDASTEAYAAAVYLRHELEDGRTHVAFVMGKARVSPPKVVTIPRLELTAARLAADLAEAARRELEIPIKSRTFWSDSMTVLKYLRNKSKRFHVFVANRICAILNVSQVEEWRHVPTKLNPADEASRGLSASALKDSMWLTGPPFLAQPAHMWPQDPDVAIEEADDPEIRREEKAAVTLEGKGSLMEIMAERQRTAFRVRYHVAIWIKFKEWLHGGRVNKPGSISAKDLQHAESNILRCLQQEIWPEELTKIAQKEPLPKRSPLYKLNPVLDEKSGVVHMNSRTRASLPIVPPSEFADRLVQEAHEQQGHQGRQATTAALLRHYWIVGINKSVRKIVRRCPSCQRRHSTPAVTAMAPLPPYRCEQQMQKSFYVTGVDYFGPFHVARPKSRSSMKAYGVIFTCAATRAIHLEAAEDLSSSCFINALRRFIARRGRVHMLVSDNGTNFVGANRIMNNLLKKELEKQKVSVQVGNELRKQGIEWKFNAPNASHHGGFWERLIRSVRRILGALLEERRLSHEVFITTLCECEFILNNRPITPVSEDPQDLEALTPNHLLLGSRWPEGAEPIDSFDYKSTTNALQHRWKQVQCLVGEFWRRWVAEYKVLLHQRVKWHRVANRKLMVNDPVLVVDPLHSREYWRLGRVVAIHPNPIDGLVRTVDVKTKKGLLTRPITKLCLLETASENSEAA